MNIAISQNIYAALFALVLPDDLKEKISIKESSLITKELKEGKFDVGLIPSCDLLTHNDLFVSNKYGISFEGTLSNSYLYFVPEQISFKKILLRGDISSNDLILSKILFSEQFDTEAEFSIDTRDIDLDNNNYLIAGLENNQYAITNNGISFAEQFADLIDYPYVNFVLASTNEEKLKEFSSRLDEIDDKILKELDSLIDKLGVDQNLKNYLKDHHESIYFNLTNNEIEGLNEQLRLAYYHGIISDVVEVNFV